MMMMEENSSIKSAVSSMVLGSSSGGIAAGGESAAGSEIIPHHQQLQHDPAVNATTVSVRIYVPELNVQKVIHFHREELVWNVKQQCLASLPKELKESFNYGLFYPPSNGRAGKFLDEERPLSDYPFNGPGGYLELKYKRRVYKMLHLDEKQLRSLHTRVNLRRFFDYVTSGQTEKITKMCAKGLDPNIHCQETGETPLTLAAVSSRPGPLLLALVGGGALIDYRTRCGSTALHRASEKSSIEAVRTLLDLGASPNVRDAKGLTPLWTAVSAKASPMLCQALLHDYSIHGVQDAQGWHEVHQACRNGLVQHLENLLFYGADMNAKNASGNTPLHVCAVDNQEACARLLLFRGADREALNYANQTPYQVAVIAGNLELAALIHRFRGEDVVAFKETPSFNPRRRKSGVLLSMRHSMSSNAMMLDASSIASSSTTGSSSTPSPTLVYSSLTSRSMNRRQQQQPSPSPSSTDRWLESNPMCMSTVSVRSDTGSSSSCTAESEDNGSSLTDKISVDQCDIVSDSSGVGTSNSGSGGSYDANTPSEHSLVLPGMTVVCTEAYSCKEANHLNLQPGDIIEVTGSTDCGLLEGWLRGDSGYFPPSCVQEVRLRNPAAIAAARHHPSPAVISKATGVPNMGMTLPVPVPVLQLGKTMEARAAGRREMTAQNYGTTPRMKSLYSEPRTVILHKGQRGFGFVLRGAKTMTGMKDFNPIQNRVPALQYLDSVEAGSVADRAGLQPGDFILAINGEDLAKASHETVVDCIRRSGNLVQLTICSATVQPVNQSVSQSVSEYALTVPNSSRQYSTLPRKLPGRPPQPPKRDPRTTLSVGRARARSMVVALNDMESSQSSTETAEDIYSNSSSSRTASIRSRSGSGRVSTTDLERLSIPTAVSPPAPPAENNRSPRVYASVAEMKRMRKTSAELLKLHKEFHSTPELCWEQQQNGEVMTSSWTAEVEIPPDVQSAEDWRKSQSQENVYGMELQVHNQRNSRRSWAPGNAASKPGGPRHSGVRYHGSWQNIEDSYHQSEDDDDGDETEEEEEEDGDDDGEDATTPIADQLNLLGNRDYRAVKPCRPIYSTGNCNTLPKRAGSPHCTAPPPNHPPPPPPPPSQVVRVDVTKAHSEYAAVAAAGGDRPTTPVMSSFRPSDNAKLYALPEDMKNVGYMTLRPTGSKKMTNVQSSMTGSPPSSAASRSKSLPPRSSRPNVQVKSAKNEEPRVSVTVNSTPLIPDPDYDSEEEAAQNGLAAGKASRMMVAHSTAADNEPPRTKLLIEIKPQSQPIEIKQPNPPRQPQRVEVEGRKSEGNRASLPKSQSFCADILKAKSLLKNSQSFPEELSDQLVQDSYCEDAYVTFVPVNGSSSQSEESQYGHTKNGRRTGTLTRHAVSLIQLPPPVENGEPDMEDRLQSQQSDMAVEQDSVSTISTLSSLSTSTNSSERDDATILENHKPVKKINGHWREAGAPSSSEHQTTSDGERTIEESLQLIRKHVDELSGMNRSPAKKTAPVVPPPPQFIEAVASSSSENEESFLAPPPPEFSDSVMMMTHKPGQRQLPKSMSSGQLRGALGDGSDDAVPISFSSHFLNRRMVERRLSDDAISSSSSKPPTVRVVGTVPKKVSFSPDVIEAETTRAGHQEMVVSTRRFPHKPLHEWTVSDTADWLDSIFLNEYKNVFMKRNIDGPSLMHINSETLMSMGVKRLGHRLNIEKSLKHYARDPRN
ncbi:SH3 and multiple ankyrin repeat domains protein 3-like isoform X6 [Daphnia pulex]|uniref:SH3 and multiple ankyrin repeat domains protein 3-like isoform X6 n=1 Tax=Daphnia pulex TaxID=6669 RepID=UPI001EDD0725|nr:SH3 and multiple ankyrin repeat domains protein 3-like isoform X6 [Daphnia pulex]XP_046439351.1 SH3 and multiple ankyrin repeat domains protein 3-like isoform X6 [Daphnia pulex]